MDYRFKWTGKRGVHGVPGPHQGGWLADPKTRQETIDYIVSMGLDWITWLTSGDSCLTEFDGKPAVCWMLDAGVIPVIRDYREDRGDKRSDKLPAPFNNQATVARLAEIYSDYGLVPVIQPWNEPDNPREWGTGRVPHDWYEQFVPLWNHAATVIWNHGGLPVFPGADIPLDWSRCNPFRDADREHWERGAGYGTHCYGRGRPRRYPELAAVQAGAPLTNARYTFLLDDYSEDPNWRPDSLDAINLQRYDWSLPGLTYMEDQTCWWRWKAVELHAIRQLGFTVPQFLTECGWVPRDRAYSYQYGADIRWPLTTPRRVAAYTAAAFRELESHTNSVVAAMPWLLHSPEGGPWSDAAWLGGAWFDRYGYAKPVVAVLQKAKTKKETIT